MASSSLSTILVIGGTSGLGEGLARRFHAAGKKVIVTGRRQDRLDALSAELPGLEGYQWDVNDLDNISTHAQALISKYPHLDGVILMAGIMSTFNWFDPASTSDSALATEVTTNLTFPMLAARSFIPHLASLASSGKPAAFIPVSSGMAYINRGVFPAYCPTKAGIHAFCITLRQQLSLHPDEGVKKNLSICELVPPYVDTNLDGAFRDKVKAVLGDKQPPPMPLQEYLDGAMEGFDKKGPDGKMLKEVTVPGFGEMGVRTWRESFGKVLEGMGMDC